MSTKDFPLPFESELITALLRETKRITGSHIRQLTGPEKKAIFDTIFETTMMFLFNIPIEELNKLYEEFKGNPAGIFEIIKEKFSQR